MLWCLGSVNGTIEFPLSVFKTLQVTPKETLVLQPSGTWMRHAFVHTVVLDFEGKLVIDLQQGKLPLITFKTNKPIRSVVNIKWSTWKCTSFKLYNVNEDMVSNTI